MPPVTIPGPGVLYFPGLLYESVLRLRNALYGSGFLPTRRLSRPVLSVGNLTLGGTGKTPFVIYLAALLTRSHHIPALLSRGYGRSAQQREIVLAPSETITNPASELGDEPALIRRKIPQIWVGVSKDRHGTGTRILRRESRAVFILDDGFQHRRIHREVDLLMIDTSQDLALNRVFPRGTLREPLSSIRRAHVIVLNGSRNGPAPHPHETFIRECHPAAIILHCTQEIESLQPHEEWQRGAIPSPGRRDPGPAFLVAAIGNPARFRSRVEDYGVRVSGSRFFHDHRRIVREEWEQCAREARESGAECLITTEKDAVKTVTPTTRPVYVALQRTHLEEEDRLRALLFKILEGYS